jgi:hypothetical protein
MLVLKIHQIVYIFGRHLTKRIKILRFYCFVYLQNIKRENRFSLHKRSIKDNTAYLNFYEVFFQT